MSLRDFLVGVLKALIFIAIEFCAAWIFKEEDPTRFCLIGLIVYYFCDRESRR